MWILTHQHGMKMSLLSMILKTSNNNDDKAFNGTQTGITDGNYLRINPGVEYIHSPAMVGTWIFDV